jgi:predicted Zn-dependent protease
MKAGLVLVGLLALVLSGCANMDLKNLKAEDIQGLLQVGSAAVDASRDITEEQEHYLGESVSARLLAKYPLLENRPLTSYVNLVGATVAASSDRPDIPFHFAVLDSPEVNAFAAPGGYVFVTRGSLEHMRSEDQLAAVLAHEVGHVCARHAVKSIQQAKWKQVGTLSAKVGLSMSGADPGMVKLLDEVSNSLVDTLVFKGFSRAEEREADRLAVAYCARAGYDPQAMVDYLAVLGHGGSEGTLASLSRTHPAPAEREANVKEAIAEGKRPAQNEEAAARRLARFKRQAL